MKKFKIFFLVLLALALAFIGGGLVLPSKWRVERSVVVQAPPASIYPLIANFMSGWPQWSAFDSEDPGIQYAFSGPNEGVGAARSWTSLKMGNGAQKIVKADATAGIEFELTMERNRFGLIGRLALERVDSPDGMDATKVTWTNFGEVGANPMHRYLAALMDKMMGSAFERSLAKLKRKAEAAEKSKP